MPLPLSGLALADNLKPVFAQKTKTFDEKTISAATKEALALKLAGEESDGWRVLRTNQKSIRLAKSKQTDRQLEDDVWCLFYRMGFKELNVDRQFSIAAGAKTPPRQLDVFAKDDDAVFIVECTHSKEIGPTSVKALIDKIGGIRDEVIKAVHAHYGKTPKLKVKFAIASRNIEWRAADKARAATSGIPVITESDLTYFNRLTDFLRTAARYQFLARYFKGEKVEGLRTKVPATKGWMGGQAFYNFVISPHDLLKIAYISHKAKTSNDDLETYQRMVKPSRLKAIGSYIDDGGKFPTNIVVNFKMAGHLNFDLKENFDETATGVLTLPGQYGSAWVIDGQHRLYGYSHASRPEDADKSVIPVLAYENLPIREEIQLFVDVNTKQVKVSRNLVNEILSSLNINDEDPTKRLDALCARVALRLDEYPTSPIRDRILTVSQDKSNFRCLTLTSLADGISENGLLGTILKSKGGIGAFAPGPLGDPSSDPTLIMEKAVSTLSRYLSIFAVKLEPNWQSGDAKGGYLCTNNGIRTLLRLFRKIISFVENKEGVKALIMAPEDIVRYVDPYVAHVVKFFGGADANQVSAFRGRGSSLLSVSQNCLQMMSIIHECDASFNIPEVVAYMSSRDMEGTKQAKDMIDDINKMIFDDVLASLRGKYGTVQEAWWVKGVPKAVKNSCDQRYNESQGEHERWQYLTLANYPEIIMHSDNWEMFRDYYNFYGKGKKGDLIRWIGRVNKARTVTHHAEKGPLSKEDVEYVRLVHQLVRTHIGGREKVIANRRGPLDRQEQEPSPAATDG